LRGRGASGINLDREKKKKKKKKKESEGRCEACTTRGKERKRGRDAAPPSTSLRRKRADAPPDTVGSQRGQAAPYLCGRGAAIIGLIFEERRVPKEKKRAHRKKGAKPGTEKAPHVAQRKRHLRLHHP